MKAFRVFKGSETYQVDGATGEPAEQEAWYFEPLDYTGDVLWSDGYMMAKYAAAVAELWGETDPAAIEV